MDYYHYYDVNSTCPEGYELYYKETVYVWNFHLRGALSYLIILFNVLVVFMFARNNVWNPATVLFILLAISDSLASICQSVPAHYALILGLVGEEDTEQSTINHQFCPLLLITEGPLYYSLHATSILLTTMLGIIKALAIKFPIWFRNHVGKKVPIIAAVCFLIASLGIEMYPVFTFSFLPDAEGWCCYNEGFGKYLYEYSFVGQWVIPIMYLSSFMILAFTSTYIAGKLTCCRSDFQHLTTSTEATRRKRISAINVVLVTLIFLVTEFLDFMFVLSTLLTQVFGAIDIYEYEWFRNAFQFSEILVQVGFSSNFIVYLITSREIRRNLKDLLMCRPRRRPMGSFRRTMTRSLVYDSGHASNRKSVVKKCQGTHDNMEPPWIVPGHDDIIPKSELEQNRFGASSISNCE